MPDIRPFRGVRYDMARVGAMSDVVAPPYDVIDPALQDRLYDASPYNVIRLELNREEAGDDPDVNRYTRAAGLLRDWLRRESFAWTTTPPCTSITRPSRSKGQTYTRKGFIARVRLEPFGQGEIFPHEQTLSGPKADRLALFHATHYNLSPCSVSTPTTAGQVLARPRPASATGPPSRRPTTSASSTACGP